MGAIPVLEANTHMLTSSGLYSGNKRNKIPFPLEKRLRVLVTQYILQWNIMYKWPLQILLKGPIVDVLVMCADWNGTLVALFDYEL